MSEQGSAKMVNNGAAVDRPDNARAEWFAAWDTIGALARDAGALHEKCGGHCTVDELQQWRERVLAQLQETLAEEERFFDRICEHCDS